MYPQSNIIMIWWGSKLSRCNAGEGRYGFQGGRAFPKFQNSRNRRPRSSSVFESESGQGPVPHSTVRIEPEIGSYTLVNRYIPSPNDILSMLWSNSYSYRKRWIYKASYSWSLLVTTHWIHVSIEDLPDLYRGEGSGERRPLVPVPHHTVQWVENNMFDLYSHPILTFLNYPLSPILYESTHLMQSSQRKGRGVAGLGLGIHAWHTSLTMPNDPTIMIRLEQNNAHVDQNSHAMRL